MVGAFQAFHYATAAKFSHRISDYFTEAAELICSLIVSMKRIIWWAKLRFPKHWWAVGYSLHLIFALALHSIGSMLRCLSSLIIHAFALQAVL